MLPIISYADLSCPSEPGEYEFQGSIIHVDNQHLQMWTQQPQACFSTILLSRNGDTSRRLTLGASVDR